MNSGLLTTCLSSTSDDPANIVVTFDGLPTTCGTGTWSSRMEVALSPTIQPGIYTVTVREIELLGALLAAHPWPLTVSGQATTTTLISVPTLPTVTITPPTTSTTLTTTTTIPPVTITQAPTTSTPRGVEPPPVNEPDPDGAGSPAPGAGSTTSTSPPPPPGDGGPTAGPARIGETEPFSEIAVSSGLIELADRALPPVFAQAIASPFILLEVLLRALGRTTGALIVPLMLTVALGIGLALRLRRDAAGLPDLEDRLVIPVEETGEDL